MVDNSACPPEAGSRLCEASPLDVQTSFGAGRHCPECRRDGKPVQGQTVKALVCVSLRKVLSTDYLFCGTQTCPVVYFAADMSHAFTLDQVRERVYQKEPDAHDVFVCYCFRHTMGEVRTTLPRAEGIIENVRAGIHAGQCACDIRNPQGSCCLGNMRGLLKHLAGPASERSPETTR